MSTPLANRGRLLTTAVDDLAALCPSNVFCIHSLSRDISDGWRSVTFKTLAGAVDNLAWWIANNIGESKSLEVLSYVGANDIRYAIFILACLKTGHVAFFPSPRNAKKITEELLETAGCSKMIFSSDRQTDVIELQGKKSQLKTWEIPSLLELLDGKSEPFNCSKIFGSAEDESAVILHSSGSTGTPKLVPLTNGYISVLDYITRLPVPEGRTSIMPSSLGTGGPILSMSPFYHMMGLYMFTESIFHSTPFIQVPEAPVTPELFNRIVKATRPVNAMFPPSVLEELSLSDEGLEGMQLLQAVLFSGAPLSSTAGRILAGKVQLCSFLGSTEAGVIPMLAAEDQDDWEYCEWNPLGGATMLPVAKELYELVLCRPGNGSRDYQGIFHTFPDRYTYNTNDLFSPHPTKPNLWKFQGRLDSVLVLSNGEKFNPSSMEKMIEDHPLVSRAIVVGQGKFQAALLVEPIWDQLGDTSETSFLDQLWPVVQEANRLAPGHGQIFRSKLGTASRGKPFRTSPKGAILRRQIMLDYTEEIEELYTGPDMEVIGGKLPPSATLADFAKYIRETVASIVQRTDISDTLDLSLQGVDSLQALRLVKALQGALHSQYPGTDFEAITTQRLYSYPTVAALSGFMHAVATGGTGLPNGGALDDRVRSEIFAASVQKVTSNFHKDRVAQSKKTNVSEQTVLLTGSTGNLGTYLLGGLLGDSSVRRIFCLNRSTDALAKQLRSFEARGLSIAPSILLSKAKFIQLRLGQDLLGVDPFVYDQLKQSVDTIFHCAWEVNFNRSLADFEDVELKGLADMLAFAMDCEHHVNFQFVSSIATVGRWGTKYEFTNGVPEEIIEDAAMVPLQGYAEAKHVAERVCAVAASSCSGITITTYRVGQLGGPTTAEGSWNKTEWLPALIATSKTIGQIPKNLGQIPINWIPVDILARIILEISATRRPRRAGSEGSASLFNLVNPTVIPWQSLLATMQKRFPVEPVDDAAWLARLNDIHDISAADIETMPALKILDVYKRIFAPDVYPKFGIRTDKGQEASSTMQDLGPVDGQLMELWMDQWGL
ncbi:hypothetical protein BJY04DRAFT_231506 [Aspergillus karnatakaensis]|uniref:uncharacterized protein n=1 Tax=Aspergillus karnatakaensis TaxID=1810916 RepID=UPI003CCD35C6